MIDTQEVLRLPLLASSNCTLQLEVLGSSYMFETRLYQASPRFESAEQT